MPQDDFTELHYRIALTMESAVGYGTDWIWWTFREIVMHAVDKLAMCGCSFQNLCKTFTIKIYFIRVAPGQVNQCGSYISILHQGIGSLTRIYPGAPTGNQGSMYARIIVCPLATWELRSLFRGKKYKGVLIRS